MNRLILIGNGFDLAHGLKTSYHDFILDYLKKCFKVAINRAKEYPNLITKEFQYKDEIISVSIKREFYINGMYDIDSFESVEELELNTKNYLNINFHFKENTGLNFIENIITNTNIEKWVDIENLYYEELLRLKIEYDTCSGVRKNQRNTICRVIQLNKQLDFIKDKLQKYLCAIDTSVEIKSIKNLINQDIYYKEKNPFDNNILLLNFNYTGTHVKYINDCDRIINIHGELINPNNPLIFGFGDEVDRNYKEIEDINQNVFFTHIKSFDYFKTPNYGNLLRFIRFGEFEIYVMGHSCGLSDRTMLSTIFNHENCKFIKIFYNPNDVNDYRNKTYEISRHFKNKAAMREKIIPFPNALPMPQLNTN